MLLKPLEENLPVVFTRSLKIEAINNFISKILRKVSHDTLFAHGKENYQVNKTSAHTTRGFIRSRGSEMSIWMEEEGIATTASLLCPTPMSASETLTSSPISSSPPLACTRHSP